jgi:hypothetical protein
MLTNLRGWSPTSEDGHQSQKMFTNLRGWSPTSEVVTILRGWSPTSEDGDHPQRMVTNLRGWSTTSEDGHIGMTDRKWSLPDGQLNAAIL